MFPVNSKTPEQKSKLTRRYLTAGLALTALITSPQAKAEDDFTGLGFLPNFTSSATNATSVDGSVVVAHVTGNNYNDKAFR